jgi:hypothetical protein
LVDLVGGQAGPAAGGRADVALSALRAGEVVVRAGLGPRECYELGGGVAAGVGDVLGSAEGVPVDQRFVGVGDVDVAVGDVADVGGVVEDAVDGVRPSPGTAHPDSSGSSPPCPMSLLPSSSPYRRAPANVDSGGRALGAVVPP